MSKAGLEDGEVLGVQRGEGDVACFPLRPRACAVDEDAKQPGPQRRAALEGLQAAEHRKPGFLRHVIGRRGRTHECASDTAQSRIVACDEALECLLVADSQPLEKLMVLVHRHRRVRSSIYPAAVIAAPAGETTHQCPPYSST